MRKLSTIALMLMLAGCTTPYSPAIISNGSKPFQGIAHLMNGDAAVDVVLVHGMCTHDESDAHTAMDEIVAALGANVRPRTEPRASIRSTDSVAVEIVARENDVLGSKVRFWGLVWSGMTAALKEQLRYDLTAEPNDCRRAEPGTCKPQRATLNGALKDSLLNDCLADALVYQGRSRVAMRDAMVAALNEVVTRGGANDRPLVLVSSSLGSKILFDALSQMLDSPEGSVSNTSARRLSHHVGTVFMQANQLPILALADQDAGGSSTASARGPAGRVADALRPLQRLAEERSRANAMAARVMFGPLKVVAFTDPNDLLSYRLLGWPVVSDPSIEFADVLVSNQPTVLGLIENPASAHTRYSRNPDVARFIACGEPKSDRCK